MTKSVSRHYIFYYIYKMNILSRSILSLFISLFISLAFADEPYDGEVFLKDEGRTYNVMHVHSRQSKPKGLHLWYGGIAKNLDECDHTNGHQGILQIFKGDKRIYCTAPPCLNASMVITWWEVCCRPEWYLRQELTSVGSLLNWGWVVIQQKNRVWRTEFFLCHYQFWIHFLVPPIASSNKPGWARVWQASSHIKW